MTTENERKIICPLCFVSIYYYPSLEGKKRLIMKYSEHITGYHHIVNYDLSKNNLYTSAIYDIYKKIKNELIKKRLVE